MAQPELSLKGQRWYRGARELLVQVNYSGLKEFDLCYDSNDNGGRWFCDIAQYLDHGLRSVDYGFKEVGQKAEHYSLFAQCFTKARALVAAAVEELKSRYLPVVTQLSFAISADEFETAENVLRASNGDEALTRAAGVVARVALERHLLTTLDSRSIAVEKNPPQKKKAEAADALLTLARHNLITPIQRSELQTLFAIANNCAHPKEKVKDDDVQRLIQRGAELCSIIL